MASPSTLTTPAAPTVGERKVKMANVLDQSDDTEILVDKNSTKDEVPTRRVSSRQLLDKVLVVLQGGNRHRVEHDERCPVNLEAG